MTTLCLFCAVYLSAGDIYTGAETERGARRQRDYGRNRLPLQLLIPSTVYRATFTPYQAQSITFTGTQHAPYWTTSRSRRRRRRMGVNSTVRLQSKMPLQREDWHSGIT